ncbi:hypothetical protein [Bradyrhizobium elkanii]|uniref:hypothetical protein n=1 Tax=Bradyrhizobium elkanii TaxID=29448 RepID=UPI003516CD11
MKKLMLTLLVTAMISPALAQSMPGTPAQPSAPTPSAPLPIEKAETDKTSAPEKPSAPAPKIAAGARVVAWLPPGGYTDIMGSGLPMPLDAGAVGSSNGDLSKVTIAQQYAFVKMKVPTTSGLGSTLNSLAFQAEGLFRAESAGRYSIRIGVVENGRRSSTSACAARITVDGQSVITTGYEVGPHAPVVPTAGGMMLDPGYHQIQIATWCNVWDRDSKAESFVWSAQVMTPGADDYAPLQIYRQAKN